ncbi:efflux RND transporter periplasmic adaptor subunit [Paenirhodobacter enshiensis]|uniref:efflux RND transporter periplasmic adaptor subunit n=1 Tax=Paenirhodobacter enshiensis TaxID=1105367 RepID=UPI00068B3563|nr:efflux RND transporter periplasmic adaptor subunit [Paenirhodobacter enshiensis]
MTVFASRFRWGAIGIAAVCLVALAGYVLYRGKLGASPQSGYLTATVTRGSVESSVLATGTLKPHRWVAVGAQVSGRIEKLNVKLGDTVKAGDLIAQIDPSTQTNDLRSAEAALADVQAQLAEQRINLGYYEGVLQREQKTYAAHGSAKSDLDAAQNDVDVTRLKIDSLGAQVTKAQVDVDNAKVDLGYTRITAPIDGTIIAVVSQEGQTVNAVQSTPTIVVVAQLDVMTVRAEISEADVVSVKPGQKAWFTIVGDRQNRYEAKLGFVEPAPEDVEKDSALTSSSSSSTSSSSSSDTAIYYIGTFDIANADGRLLTYMTAEVHFIVASVTDVLTVPVAALSDPDESGGRTVRVLGQDGTVSVRAVRLGASDKSTAEVVSGLSEGEKVVLGDTAAISSAPKRMPPMGM